MPLISFLLPTRGKPDLARRFLHSLYETADCPEEIEVILGVDADDPQSHGISHEGLLTKAVILPAGLTMGDLNRACFDASTGRYVMLINDDVIVRTQGWDTAVYRTFARYGDDVGLVHVNDLLFQERLCTFPILSRAACLEIGVCPPCYRRYRIDDHIYDTYYLLAYLGYGRMTYLKDVVFEHENYTAANTAHAHATASNTFQADDGRVYVLNPEALENDSREFTERLEDRKRDARKLAGLIETAARDNRLAAHANMVADIHDSYSYRPRCSVAPAADGAGGGAARRATVAVVTSDLRRGHAARCLARLKQYTSDYDLIILDNNGSRQFNHPREMNKILRAARTDYVVLLDDDVYVTPGWLEALMDSVGPRTGIVTPLHRDRRGQISYSGVYFNGDGQGSHAHTLDVPAAPRPCQCVCSAAVLIDRRKCGNIFFNENYQKYFLDLDYALQVWEAGYEVLCTPRATVTHLGGGTMAYTSAESMAKIPADRNTFLSTWLVTGRLGRIESGIWSGNDYLRELAAMPGRITRVFDAADGLSRDQLQRLLDALIEELRPTPKFFELLAPLIQEQACLCRARGENDQAAYLSTAAESLCPRRLSTRLVRRLKRQAATVLKPLAAKGRALATKHPWVRRAVSSARANAAVAWHGYKRLPKAVRWMLDPAVIPVKCAVKPLLGQPERVELGLYKGFRLMRVDQMVHAMPTRHTPQGLAISGEPTHSVLAANELSRIKVMVDSLAGSLEGTNHQTTHLLKGHAAAAGGMAVEKYHGVQIIPFEGRYFGLPESDTFDLDRLRRRDYPTCWVGHSLEDIRGQVDQAQLRSAGRAGGGKENGLAQLNPLSRLVNRRAPGRRAAKQKALVLCHRPSHALPGSLMPLRDYDVTLLVPHKPGEVPSELPTLFYNRGADGRMEILNAAGQRIDMAANAYDAFVIPFVRGEYWKDVEFECLAATLAARLIIALPDGSLRQYRGQDMHRIQYNKAYLGSMLRQVPNIRGKHVLDVGCKDGLTCDLLLNEDPAAVSGIDVMESVGCAYGHAKISYARMDASRLKFDDESFDVAYTIATLEHCRDPYAVLQEMKRVTKRGGCVYAQAAPLYFSPFGHHMFGYFDDYPWIHLRLSIQGILEYCSSRKIDRKIQQALGRSAEDYVCSMMSADHVNGLTFQEYRLTEFMEAPDIEVLGFSRSREGENLLAQPIRRELTDIPYEDLTAHGFELVFRRR